MPNAYELIFKQMDNCYTWLINGLPARQDAIFRTYLWSASLALTLNFMLLQKAPVFPVLPWQTFCALSAGIAVVLIGYIVNCLRGRDEDNVDHPDYCCYLNRLSSGEYTDKNALDFIVDQMDQAIRRQRAAQTKRAKKLRGISIALTTSFMLLFVSGVLFIAT